MKLLALDGNSIINRAFYGIRPLSTKDGIFTNGIYGFLNILLKLQEEHKPDRILAAFDLKGPTFRHDMYDGYKAGRKGMPDELAMQMPIIKEILTQMGFCVLEKQGFEADDILGTLAKCADLNDDTCLIATGDRDSLQLVSQNVNVLLASTKMGSPIITVYDCDKIKEEYLVSPKQLIDIKALQGDSSDNIPGVAGIGAKTASTLISSFGSIDYIYDNIETLDIKENLKNKLIAGKELAFLSRTLGTINKDVPIEVPESCTCDLEGLKANFIRLEMHKMLERLNLGSVNIEQKEEVAQFKEVQFEEAAIIPDNSFVHFENDTLYAKCENKYYKFSPVTSEVLSANNLIVHDAKDLFHKCKVDFKPNVLFDTMLAAYLLNPEQSDYSLAKFENTLSITKATGDDSADILALDIIHELYLDFSKQLKENEQESLLNEIEIPLAYTLYCMEKEGFEVDKQGIESFNEQLSKRILELQEAVYEDVGYEFNLNSPKQLGVALFEDLKLPHGKKTKTGYSTNAEVLESLKDVHEAVEFLLEYRGVSKLKSTYCDGLLKTIGSDGRIHTTFKQAETRTGRISSTEPNLQNIPVRTELGREMRKFFIAKEGHVLVDADYSQIELRVLASIANDQTMIEAFNNEDDIHSITASQVFNVPLMMMTSDLRSKAKAVNFGIVYGIGAFSLSKDINVSVAQAKKYIDGYLETYSGVNEYMQTVVLQAKENGYVTTQFNRRRYLPELQASNNNIRSFGERVARNMPIQGTAADIIKIAMVKVFERLENENLKAKLILQVHDELIVEAPKEEAEFVARILKEEMENAVDFEVKMKADVKIGNSWFETK